MKLSIFVLFLILLMPSGYAYCYTLNTPDFTVEFPEKPQSSHSHSKGAITSSYMAYTQTGVYSLTYTKLESWIPDSSKQSYYDGLMKAQSLSKKIIGKPKGSINEINGKFNYSFVHHFDGVDFFYIGRVFFINDSEVIQLAVTAPKNWGFQDTQIKLNQFYKSLSVKSKFSGGNSNNETPQPQTQKQVKSMGMLNLLLLAGAFCLPAIIIRNKILEKPMNQKNASFAALAIWLCVFLTMYLIYGAGNNGSVNAVAAIAAVFSYSKLRANNNDKGALPEKDEGK